MIRVELFGIARERAGQAAVELSARNLGEAMRALAACCPGLQPEVVAGDVLAPAFLASRNGEQFLTAPEAPLEPGDHLLIIGAQAGG